MPGFNSNYPDGSFIVLKHHNWAYTYDQAMGWQIDSFLKGRHRVTVSQLIEFLKDCNPNSTVLIYSDHSTVGPLLLEDITQHNFDGSTIDNDSDDIDDDSDDLSD